MTGFRIKVKSKLYVLYIGTVGIGFYTEREIFLKCNFEFIADIFILPRTADANLKSELYSGEFQAEKNVKTHRRICLRVR